MVRLKQEIDDSSEHLDRLKAMSDGVFAIALTLLILEIKVPEIDQGRDIQFSDFVGLIPSLVSYLLSFVTISLYWICHHWFFRLIVCYDRKLLWLNLFFLMFISFQPFPAALIGRHYNSEVAWVIYAAVLTFTGLILAYLWQYSVKEDLIDRAMSLRAKTFVTYRSLVLPVFFVLSIPVAYVNIHLAQLTPLLIPVASAVLQRWHERKFRAGEP